MALVSPCRMLDAQKRAKGSNGGGTGRFLNWLRCGRRETETQMVGRSGKVSFAESRLPLAEGQVRHFAAQKVQGRTESQSRVSCSWLSVLAKSSTMTYTVPSRRLKRMSEHGSFLWRGWSHSANTQLQINSDTETLRE